MTNLPPGRELDALIAEKVMGWKFEQRHPEADNGIFPWTRVDGIRAVAPPHYSKSIADAWAVVEKWRELGFDVDITAHHGWQYGCRIAPKGTFNTSTHFESADTAPHAICLAALKAVEGKT